MASEIRLAHARSDDDRALPHDLANERRIIGVAIRHRDVAAGLIARGVKAEMFYRRGHGYVWQAAESLAEHGAQPDLTLVVNRLSEKQLAEVGGAYALEQLIECVPKPDAGNLDYYAGTLIDGHIRRQRLAQLDRAASRLMDGSDLDTVNAELEVLARPLIETQEADRSATMDDVDILQQQDKPPLVAGRISQGDLVVVVGASGSAKSFLIDDLGCQTTFGGMWMGARVTNPGGVLIAALEGRAGIKARIHAWKLHHECELDQRLGVRFYRDDLSLMDIASVERFIRAARSIAELRLVIIDTYTRALSPGDENSSQDVGIAIAALDRIRAATGATVIVIHHLIHDGSRERGSTALRGAVDVLMKVKVLDDGVREVTSEKVRDLEDFETFHFRLVPVGPSCVPVLVDQPMPDTAVSGSPALVERAIALMDAHPGLSKRQLAQRLGGRTAVAIKAIDAARDLR